MQMNKQEIETKMKVLYDRWHGKPTPIRATKEWFEWKRDRITYRIYKHDLIMLDKKEATPEDAKEIFETK